MPSCPKTVRKRDRSQRFRACVTNKVNKDDRKAPSRSFTLKYQIMNYAQCREDQNQGIKFGTLVITDISRCLKGHTNKLRYVTVFIHKTTRIHCERIPAVSPEIWFPSFMMETNLRKGGLVHQVPCAKSREKLQEFCLYRQRKLKILNVEDKRTKSEWSKGDLSQFSEWCKDIYIYIYIYIYVYLYEKKHYRLPKAPFYILWL